MTKVFPGAFPGDLRTSRDHPLLYNRLTAATLFPLNIFSCSVHGPDDPLILFGQTKQQQTSNIPMLIGCLAESPAMRVPQRVSFPCATQEQNAFCPPSMFMKFN
jgi:hypothetical protein